MRVLEKTHPNSKKSSVLDESARGKLDFLPARKERFTLSVDETPHNSNDFGGVQFLRKNAIRNCIKNRFCAIFIVFRTKNCTTDSPEDRLYSMTFAFFERKIAQLAAGT